MVNEPEEKADCQSAGGMAWYEGAGEVSVCEDRAMRTRDGAFGNLDSCERKWLPTPPTPTFIQLSVKLD